MFFGEKINLEKIALWIKRNFRVILLILSLSALTALFFVGGHQWRKHQETKIQDSLYELKRSLKALRQDPKDKTEEKLMDLLTAPDKKEKPPFSEAMKEKARVYEEAIRQNHKSRTALAFAVDLADFYYQRGEREKAKDLLTLFAFPKRSSDGYHLASFQLASYFMDERECEKALAILSVLSENPKAAYLHLESRLQQAICLERLNRYDQALRVYEDIINKDPQAYSGRLAQDYKRLLLLNRNLKKEK